MSLIAHYPLNGDLKDYSGNRNDLIRYLPSDQLIESEEGKIGKCYQKLNYGVGADYLKSTNKINLQGDFTFAVWAYVTETAPTANGLVSNHDHRYNSGSGITIRQINESDFRISCNTGSSTERTYNGYYGTTNIKNKWSHLIVRFTKRTNTFDLIVNGNIEKTFTYSQYNIEDYIGVFVWSIGTITSPTYKPGCKLNDVRVYDHALSTKEIKDLAKAKILHYTFNDYQEPTVNMAYDTFSFYSSYHTVTQNTSKNISFKMKLANRYLVISNSSFGSLQNRTFSYSGYMKKNGIPYFPTGNNSFNPYNSAAGDVIHFYCDYDSGYFEETMHFSSTSGWIMHKYKMK